MSRSTGAAPKATDRGAWRLVAARDFSVRLRDKGFVISTGITLSVLTVFILLRAFGGESTPSFRLGLAGPGVQATAEMLDYEAAGERRGVRVEVVDLADESAARTALRAGEVDAIAVDGATALVGETSVPPQLTQIVQEALARGRVAWALGEAGVPQREIDELLNQPAISVRTLETQDPDRDENAGVAFIAVLIAYGQLFGYGVWVATGVIEEKASRVVEILLSAIRPRQLLAGKIAGIGLLGIVQLIAIATYAIVLAVVTGALPIPPPRPASRSWCSRGS